MSNIKFDTDRLNQIIQNSSTQKNAQTSQSPSQSDVSFFEKELQQKEERDNGEQTPKSAPLESLFQDAFKTKGTEQAAQISAPSANAELGEITEKMVERILVSDPKAGEQEIRIKLSDNILKDTEISIKRLNDGSLQIQLSSNNINSQQTLIAQQFELKNRLEQIENTEVSVEVNTENQEEKNDAEQQSRGLFDLYDYYKKD